MLEHKTPVDAAFSWSTSKFSSLPNLGKCLW